ncbi:hypothetical protein CSKR_111681 [Clonorchis sinensis]|uniref:Uncharacterized protein n=1 Tax=Clonorchis sinensis TaxID=79923 RepID=A0A419PEK2_CLOSI|nr:hypothetical protein CSKR_111681 [Clonorchis sinensis]
MTVAMILGSLLQNSAEEKYNETRRLKTLTHIRAVREHWYLHFDLISDTTFKRAGRLQAAAQVRGTMPPPQWDKGWHWLANAKRCVKYSTEVMFAIPIHTVSRSPIKSQVKLQPSHVFRTKQMELCLAMLWNIGSSGALIDCWSVRRAWQLDCKRFITNRGDIISAGLSGTHSILRRLGTHGT